METVRDFILGRPKITADGDCSHEIKRHLLLGRKAMTKLDSIFKSRHYFATKVHLVKVLVFPAVMYGCESCTIKKAECRRIDAFELWCWRKLLRVPWIVRRSNQSILQGISPEYSLKGLMLKLELQYFGHLMWSRLTEKDTEAKEDWKQEKGTTDYEIAGWHHWLNGRQSEWTPGVGNGQGGLTCSTHGVAKSWTRLSDWTELSDGNSGFSFLGNLHTGFQSSCTNLPSH